MYCSKCGKEMEDGATFCSGCGTPLQPVNSEPKNNGNLEMGIAALVLGIVGLLAWIIPIIGLPVGVVALILGIMGLKKSSKAMSIAGIVLGIVCLVLTIINAAIGAYQGFHGTAWFQNKVEVTEESTSESALFEPQEENVLTFRDEDGNVLMTNGVQSVGISTIDSGNGIHTYAVEIMFDKKATESFAKITEEHIGECIGIYLNDNIIANPRVMSAITGGSCNVETTTYEDAQRIADALESCN